ncbi:TetR/AcrR family transcriptional regulator [Burkholderia cenocepacia]|uniref:TetR/AcrR family transcriptional regulator n=1 Tax=Burkholderia cenocepacia TaxID=95486 RepID=UPI000A036B59|nr:TetR/AcrR family transcriptional regulator [Burkholderia cenocepacia]MCW3674605.1 TetR/AcrR family transcriptional regulator [Burkholderia cenocepacia]MDC6082479.1 TetR/AcrR family transcriptional regulator [Burkholderia cenocepacia]SPV02560.1 transcriptional regulator TetR family [Burkholderia cenocepacia]
MKKSKIEAARTRERIVKAAAQAFRRKGIQATSVADIMSSVGMTHGGFYRHFASKEHLVAEACAAGMQAARDAVDGSAWAGMLEESLGEGVSDVPQGGDLEPRFWDVGRGVGLSGCPLIGIGSELARADPGTRHAATHGYLELIAAMASRGQLDKGAAIFAFSAILGAVTMSRIVDDPVLARRVLDETQRRLAALWLPATVAQVASGNEDAKATAAASNGIGNR